MIKSKKLWLCFMFGIILVGTVCIFVSQKSEKKVYAGARIVENESPENIEFDEWRAA